MKSRLERLLCRSFLYGELCRDYGGSLSLLV
nr:MAG TPA: hypothetical protein [Caudoviricetes sp.]